MPKLNWRPVVKVYCGFDRLVKGTMDLNLDWPQGFACKRMLLVDRGVCC